MTAEAGGPNLGGKPLSPRETSPIVDRHEGLRRADLFGSARCAERPLPAACCLSIPVPSPHRLPTASRDSGTPRPFQGTFDDMILRHPAALHRPFRVLTSLPRLRCLSIATWQLQLLLAWTFLLSQAISATAAPEAGVPDTASAATASTPPDWTAEVISDQVKNATALCVDDRGNIYVTETYRWREGIEDNRNHTYWIMDDLACQTVADRSRMQQKWKDKFSRENYFTTYSDRVVRLEDRDSDGRRETLLEFATGFQEDVAGPAIGLLSGDLGIYLTCIPHLWLLQDTDGDGVAETKRSLQDGFGVKTSLSGHDLHGLAWGPDGKLYFSIGDRGFHCATREGKVLKDANAGAVFRCNPDGSEMELFYHQLRNPQELAFNELGDLFTVDNNCDQGDSARVCYLLEGGNAGWHLGTQAQTTYAAFIDDGGLKQTPHWLDEGVWKLRFPDQPAHILPPVGHLTNGPSGLAFHAGVGFGDRYRNHFLVCDYRGAPNQCHLYSFKVDRRDGGYQMRDDHLVRSGIANTDVEIGYDGRIYLSDFGGGWVRSDRGNVIGLSDPALRGAAAVQELQERFAKGFAGETNETLRELLSHADQRVRLRSQYELARRGVAARPALQWVLNESRVPVAKYHAVWALGQQKAATLLQQYLETPEHELRAQIARTLGNIGDPVAIPALRPLLVDQAPRVRIFAAIALSRLGDQGSLPSILGLVARNDNRDAFERHAGVLAMARLASPEELASLSGHSSSAVRLAAVLALRRQRHSSIARFLQDRDQQVVVETIRAINDEFIDGALPDLAHYAARYTEAPAVQPAAVPADNTRGDEGLPTELVYRRLINAALRLGRAEDALLQVRLASATHLPANYRALALKVLERFDAPAPIDATLGLHHPLPARDPQRIAAAIHQPLQQLFDGSRGELAADTLQVMHHYRLRLEEPRLLELVRDGDQPSNVRLVALSQLVAPGASAHHDLLRALLDDSRTSLRNAAARIFAAAFPAERVEALRVLLKNDHDQDYRTTFELLSSDDSPEATALLVEQLDRMLRGDLFRTVQLDLYEAARQHPSPEVQAKREAVDQLLAQSGRSVDDLTREGGNPQVGRLVFQNQGVCMKCHTGDQGGGNAGPSLTHIGRLRRPDELLQSILNPNAVVVPGYGTLTAYLDDGTLVAGTPVEDTPERLVLRTETGDLRTLERDSIEDLTPLTSPMPKQAEILTRRELRDLLAYLQTLGGEREIKRADDEAGHE